MSGFGATAKNLSAHYPDYYLPYGVTMSVDEIGVVSKQMFNKFFLPELAELSQRYGGLGMHCCANSRHQWENFKKIPGLWLLNLNQPEDILRQAYPFFADFAPQWHYGWGHEAATLEAWAAELPPTAHVVFDLTAETESKRCTCAKRLRVICRSSDLIPERCPPCIAPGTLAKK